MNTIFLTMYSLSIGTSREGQKVLQYVVSTTLNGGIVNELILLGQKGTNKVKIEESMAYMHHNIFESHVCPVVE